VGRVWQRSLAFWGFVAAAFVASGVFVDKHNLLALVIVCVCWTLVNRASRWSQNAWVSKVDSLEVAALKTKILKIADEDGAKGVLGSIVGRSALFDHTPNDRAE
jgi:hypothetical protein